MKFSELIPQLSYDLLARIIPGGFALMGISFAFQTNVIQKFISLADDKTVENTLLFWVSLLAASYIVGFLFIPISSFLEKRIFAKVFYRQFNVLDGIISGARPEYVGQVRDFLLQELDFDSPEDAKGQEDQYRHMLFIWADWLRLKDSAAGARLVKLRAEFRMHGQIAVASILILLCHLLRHAHCLSDFDYAIIVILTVSCLLSCRNSAQASQTFQRSVINNYYAAKTLKALGSEKQQPGAL